ncbi:hypothetical protein [Vibrio intestinalis]|uniref:hypothetical protein n=1 Tax=Vibrio intestinalis TaxID=2933291 RepID=UPI0021A44ACB|nr:hypothetical protein [Vibrio intestinalis]
MSNKALLIFAITSFSSLAATEQAKLTSMDAIADEQTLACDSELRTLSIESLKSNPHRMLAYNDSGSDVHLFNALAVTQYRDRKSHVTFHGVKNSEGGCDTSVTESYVLQTSCADARHEAFSKWDFQGKLDDNTMVLKAKRVEGKQAFLTDQNPNICLVTTRRMVLN